MGFERQILQFWTKVFGQKFRTIFWQSKIYRRKKLPSWAPGHDATVSYDGTDGGGGAWCLRCLRRFVDLLSVLPQTGQTHMARRRASASCTLWWACSDDFCVKLRWQIPHMWGRGSAECSCRWRRRLPALANVSWQTSHECRCRVVESCISVTCLRSRDAATKPLPQRSQTCLSTGPGQ